MSETTNQEDIKMKDKDLQMNLKLHRKISRELQIKKGITFRSEIFKDKTKYNRKIEKQRLLKELKNY